MKKLNTFKDGTYMPLWQEDFEFVQNNLIDVITEFATAFGYGNARYIVSGCGIKIDGEEYTLEKGLVMFDGELLYVPEQVEHSAIASPAFHITKELHFDTEGQKLFVLPDESTELRETYDANYGKLNIIDSSLIEETMLIAGGDTVTDVMRAKISPVDTGWLTLPLLGSYATAHVDAACKYRVFGGMVSLRGKLTLSEAVTYSGLFAQLPNQYTPSLDVSIVGADYAITTRANGELFDDLQGSVLNLNNIRFMI